MASAVMSGIRLNRDISREAYKRLSYRKQEISKDEALRIAGDFADIVRSSIDSNAKLFIFGSAVNGSAKIDSDIDVAVISEINDRDIIAGYVLFSKLANDIDWDIEVHAVSTAEWHKNNTPHVFEIKNRGVEV